jgi:dGTPase
MRPALRRCAIDIAQSRGRRHPEPAPATRNEFERDRDRIIHSSAFRRLEYKTQVFVNHEGDMFRTRLTHSLEVAQIARSVARALGLNEDLTEAIALAHDLGHTPFGHAGQHALNSCLAASGGFEHNLQSLRVVDELEQRYPDFDGLNLLFETREGILKHCTPARAVTLGELGVRFVRNQQPSLEAQLVNLADEIAYNHHDIDDGLRSGILTLDQVCEHDGFREALERAGSGKARDKRQTYTAIRHMLGAFVDDLIAASAIRLEAHAPSSVEQVRTHAAPLIDFSAAWRLAHVELKRILHQGLYADPAVVRFSEWANRIVRELFAAFDADASRLPAAQRARIEDEQLASSRVIADYIAGMTDRYALAEHGRICGSDYAHTARPWLQGS